MSRHDDAVRVRHMLDFAREATGFAAGKTRADLADDRLLDLSLLHLITLLGEAAGRVSKDYQIRYSQTPWALIVGMRNRIVHEYDFIDYDILWQTVTEDLPSLIAQLEAILADDSRP